MIRAAMLALAALSLVAEPAAADDSARMKQLRLLCARLDRDVAAFQALDPRHVALLGADYELWNETMPPPR